MMCQCIHCKSQFHVQSAKSGPNAPLCPICGKEFIAPASEAKRSFEMNFSHGIAVFALPAALIPAVGIPLAVAGLIFGGKKHSVSAVLLNILALLLAIANGAYGIYFSRITN